MPKNTKYRHLTMNMLLPKWWHLGGHTWKSRLPVIKAVIKKADPDFISAEEVDFNTAADIARALGPNWAYDRSENNAVYWRRDRWEHEKIRKFNLSGKQVRTLILVKLRNKKTKAYAWIGTTHLSVKAVNLTATAAQKEKRGQASDIMRLTKGYYWIGIGGDWNDGDYQIRNILYKLGQYKNIKQQVKPINGYLNSHTGFKPTKKNGVWIDDILNRNGIKVISAELILTGKASDHNAILEVGEIQAGGQKQMFVCSWHHDNEVSAKGKGCRRCLQDREAYKERKDKRKRERRGGTEQEDEDQSCGIVVVMLKWI